MSSNQSIWQDRHERLFQAHRELAQGDRFPAWWREMAQRDCLQARDEAMGQAWQAKREGTPFRSWVTLAMAWHRRYMDMRI